MAQHVNRARDQIVEVASMLFIKKGGLATWPEIAKLAGTSLDEVRRLFGNNKMNLFNEIFKRNWARVNTIVQEVQLNFHLNPKAKLLQLYRMILQGIKAAGPFGTTFLLQGRQGGELGDQFVKAGLHTFAKLVDEIVQQGQRDGFFRDNLPTEALRQQLIGCGESILLGWMWQGRASYPAGYTLDDACRVFEAILEGLAPLSSTSPVPQQYGQARVITAPGIGDKGTGVSARGGTMDDPSQWKHSLSSYTNAELRALKFRSLKEFERAIKLCWEHPDLKGVPRDSPDGITLIVPEQAAKHFKSARLKFEVANVSSSEDLPREKLAAMRRRYGM